MFKILEGQYFMRKKNDELRAVLLHHAQSLMQQEGLEAVNIRALAQRAGIATGTVYNYFAGKDEILLALTRQSWQEALRELERTVQGGSFLAQVEQIYRFLQEHIAGDVGVMMRSLTRVEATAQASMRAMTDMLAQDLVRRMAQDPALLPEDPALPRVDLARFVVRTMLAQLRSADCDLRVLLALLRNSLYTR